MVNSGSWPLTCAASPVADSRKGARKGMGAASRACDIPGPRSGVLVAKSSHSASKMPVCPNEVLPMEAPGHLTDPRGSRAPLTRAAPEASVCRRPDQSYKLRFSLPIAVEHLIDGLINADPAAELVFARAETWPPRRRPPGWFTQRPICSRRSAFEGAPVSFCSPTTIPLLLPYRSPLFPSILFLFAAIRTHSELPSQLASYTDQQRLSSAL